MSRSLENVTYLGVTEDGLILQCLCDCATVTQITVQTGAGQEFAYTCDGCATSHWLTIHRVAGGAQ